MSAIGTFHQWMVRVNLKLERIIEMTADDMPDLDWYSQYEDGVSVKQAVIWALNEWNFDAFGY